MKYVRTNSRNWTRDEVVDCIRQLHAAGESLRHCVMTREHRKLYRAGRRLFGTWNRAVLCSGVSAVLPTRLRWSPEKVLARIRERETEGLPINYRSVACHEPKLLQAAVRFHGNWSKALQAGGWDPAVISTRRCWTAGDLISLARARAEAGEVMSCGQIQSKMSGFYRAAKEHFGSWDGLLKAAGLSPRKYRRQRAPWSRSRLQSYLRRRARAGLALNIHSIGLSSVVHAAQRYYGSWDGALSAIGLDPARIRLRRVPWKRAEVLAAIKGRREGGLPLNAFAVAKDDTGLYFRARKFHGSWDNALRASGIDPLTVRQTRVPWTRAEVIQVISQRAKKGLSLSVEKVQPPSLRYAATRIFGSWLKAVRAARLSAEQRKNLRTYWSKDRIVREIRGRLRGRSGLSYAAVKRSDSRLLSAGVEHFGNWRAALVAAGIDPNQAAMRRRWTRSAIIQLLRAQARNGRTFREQHVGIPIIWTAAKKLFGSWAAAHRAAGISGTWRSWGSGRRFVPCWATAPGVARRS